MDSLQDLLSTYSSKEPAEVTAIKDYVSKQFKAVAKVAVQGETLVVTITSASLANALRLRLPALQEAAQTTKRIIFRIG